MTDVVLTVRLPEEQSAALAELAEQTGETASDLVSQAVALLIEEERALMAAIDEGLADAAAGRTHSHDAVMARLQALLSEPSASRS